MAAYFRKLGIIRGSVGAGVGANVSKVLGQIGTASVLSLIHILAVKRRKPDPDSSVTRTGVASIAVTPIRRCYLETVWSVV